MQKGHLLQFKCQECEHPIEFSVFELNRSPLKLSCEQCHNKYLFDDETLKRQIKKFAQLCYQLIESEEILSQTSVGIDVGHHHVKVPFKLLLTRLNSTLDLVIGDKPLSITFRLEPLKDVPSKNVKKS